MAPANHDRTIRLRHPVRKGNWRQYFYEGELPVKDSIIEVPASRPEWVQRAWIQGFRSTIDGRVIANLNMHVASELARYDDPVVEVGAPGDPFTEAQAAQAPEAPAVEKPEDDDESGCCDEECCPVDGMGNTCCEDSTCCKDNTECAGCALTPADEVETAKSGEDENSDEAGLDAGGQSPDDDGVRSSEPAGAGSDAGEGLDRGVSDEPADRTEGDGPSA